jgi:hypothetical protein
MEKDEWVVTLSLFLIRLMVKIGGYLSSSPYTEAGCKVWSMD